MLGRMGYEVGILPAVVPPNYRAHLFIPIHADGSNDSNASGYRVAAPRRDATGSASRFVRLLERSYGEATNLRRLPTVTRRMQNYYAFNFRRYEHALHPMTIGVIIETGFLTSPRDRRVLLSHPERAARGIVEAVVAFQETPPPTRPSSTYWRPTTITAAYSPASEPPWVSHELRDPPGTSTELASHSPPSCGDGFVSCFEEAAAR